MKKRLRKKLRLKEFYELLFKVEGTFTKQLSDNEVDTFVDDMCDFVDDIGVTFIGITDFNTFGYSFMGLYKYKDRLTDKQIDLIKNKFKSLSLVGVYDCKIIKTTDMED